MSERICKECGARFTNKAASDTCKRCKILAAKEWANQDAWLKRVRKLLRQHDAWLQSQ